jgi:hypothetical protein
MLRTFCIATPALSILTSILILGACKTEKRVEPEVARTAPAPAARAASRPPDPVQPAPAEPASRPETRPLDPELAARGHAMMDRLADVFVADARDCDKLAADLKTFAAENKPLLAQLVAAQSQDRRAATAQSSAAGAAIAKKMQAAMTACAAHPAVLAALQDFPAE